MLTLPIIAFLVLVFILTKEILVPEKKPEKTPEQELGEAITKYLSKGMKVRIESSEDKSAK
jgi:hypothetical protein